MNRNNKSGFTLIEMMVYIALVSGILISATSFAWQVINSRTKSSVMREVAENGRLAMDKITQAVHEAVSVQLLTPRTLVLMDDGGTIISTFDVSGEVLQLSEGGDFIDLTSRNIRVTNLEFTNLSNTAGLTRSTRNIKVMMTLAHVNPDNRSEWNFSDNFETTIELRNR